MKQLSLLALALVATVLSHSRTHAQLAPGFRVFNPISSTETLLIDNTGVTLHGWPSTFFPGLSVYVRDNGNLVRSINTGPGPAGTGGGVQELAFDGTVLWDFRYDGPGVLSHHDIEPMPGGSVLLIAWETKTKDDAVNAGRNPVTVLGNVFMPDHIVEVMPTGPTTGTIIWEWHAWDHLVQDFDPGKANFAPVQDHPELLDINFPNTVVFNGDWNHMNSVDYDPVNDWVILSSNFQDEIYVIDHSTTTAEAAGHTGGNAGKGGDILYRWGNPLSYRAGTAADQQLFSQHSATIIPEGSPGAGNLLIFNNGGGSPGSAICELVLPLDGTGSFILGPTGVYGPTAPTWTYTDSGLSSPIMSSCERLPNGNTLICNGSPGRLFEVDPSGQLLSQYNMGTTFHAHYEERTLWPQAHTFSAAAGGAVDLHVVGGTAHAGEFYWMVGSISGTSPGQSIGGGFTLPLNRDFYYLYTVQNVNAPPLTQSFGVLDNKGIGKATFTVPAGAIPAAFIGTVMHHAWVGLDATTLAVTHVSNAAPLTLLP